MSPGEMRSLPLALARIFSEIVRPGICLTIPYHQGTHKAGPLSSRSAFYGRPRSSPRGEGRGETFLRDDVPREGEGRRERDVRLRGGGPRRRPSVPPDEPRRLGVLEGGPEYVFRRRRVQCRRPVRPAPAGRLGRGGRHGPRPPRARGDGGARPAGGEGPRRPRG